jgi:hypothetical protein
MGSLSLHNITILSSLFVRVVRLDFLSSHTYVTPCKYVGKNMRNYNKLRKCHNFETIFDKHSRTEFEDHDVEATIKYYGGTCIDCRNRIQHLMIYIAYITYNTFKCHVNQTMI